MNFQPRNPRIYRLAMLVLVSFCAAFFTAGCAYKSEIRQGREQVLENINSISVGMKQSEIVNLLGHKHAQPFSKNIWVYVFRLRESGFLGSVSLLSVELTFDDVGILTAINVSRNDFDESG